MDLYCKNISEATIHFNSLSLPKIYATILFHRFSSGVAVIGDNFYRVIQSPRIITLKLL